ncbi:hypothetical protein R3P38DRAFT_3360848, partial [Favolaschia claudopus]
MASTSSSSRRRRGSVLNEEDEFSLAWAGGGGGARCAGDEGVGGDNAGLLQGEMTVHRERGYDGDANGGNGAWRSSLREVPSLIRGTGPCSPHPGSPFLRRYRPLAESVIRPVDVGLKATRGCGCVADAARGRTKDDVSLGGILDAMPWWCQDGGEWHVKKLCSSVIVTPALPTRPVIIDVGIEVGNGCSASVSLPAPSTAACERLKRETAQHVLLVPLRSGDSMSRSSSGDSINLTASWTSSAAVTLTLARLAGAVRSHFACAGAASLL